MSKADYVYVSVIVIFFLILFLITVSLFFWAIRLIYVTTPHVNVFNFDKVFAFVTTLGYVIFILLFFAFIVSLFILLLELVKS